MCNRLFVPKTMSLTVRESSAFLFLSSVMTFPRSYLVLKIVMFAIFLIINAATLIKEKTILIHVRIIVFYYLIAGIGLIWAIVGYVNGGAFVGIVDNLRLYVLWSVVLCIVFNLLLQGNAFLVFHKSIVTAGILISSMNYFALYNHVGQLGYIPDAVLRELHMYIGIHEGYIQIISHNIGALFFITAYLITIQFRKDMSSLNGSIFKLSLLMCLALVVLSGRRALWIAISMAPFLIVLLTAITDSFNQLRGRKWLLLIVFAGFIPVIVILDFALSGEFVNNSSLSHLQAAFSSSDERTLQKDYLIDGFKNYPVFGSGFGVNADYLRNEERPWLYELTYHQMLFNFGVVGISLFFTLIATYVYYAVAFISQRNQDSGYAFSMLVAIMVFSIGAYSNPYFGSFDFLLLLGVLPLITASFYVDKYRNNITSLGGS